MEEIGLKALLQIIKKRWWVVLVITIIAISAAAIYSTFIVTPIYQATTSLYIGKDLESKNALVYNDLLLGERLVNDYRELVKSRMISELVINELKLNTTDSQAISKKINVNSKKETRLIEISATDEYPEMTALIANTVANVFREKAIEIMKVENVQIIDKAEAPKYPIKPDKKLNLAIATVLGMMVGFGLIFVIEYFDDTIRTPEDVQKYLGLHIVGTIPLFPEGSSRGGVEIG